MADKTDIEWADATFNPWIGCTKVSAGCKNCYAENTTRARVLRSQGHETWGKGAKRSRTSAAAWKKPLRWNKEKLLQCPRCHWAGFESSATSEHHHSCGCGTGEMMQRRMRVFPSLCDIFDAEVETRWRLDFFHQVYVASNLDYLLLTKRPELVDWVIFGGESGANACRCNVDWIRDGVRQCKAG